MRFIIEQSNEYLTTHSGLTFVGALIAKTNLKKRLDKSSIPGVYTPNISHGDVVTYTLAYCAKEKAILITSNRLEKTTFLLYL